MNEFVQVIMTKYKNKANQNIPNYTGLVITRVCVCVLVISRVNTSHLNTSLNYR